MVSIMVMMGRGKCRQSDSMVGDVVVGEQQGPIGGPAGKPETITSNDATAGATAVNHSAIEGAGEEEEEEEMVEQENSNWHGTTAIGREFPSHPDHCMLWCAVALGALVRGEPIDNVSENVPCSNSNASRRIVIHTC